MPEITVVYGACTKVSYSAVPTDNEIHNELLASSEESITKFLFHVRDKKDLIPFDLKLDRELEYFYVDPNDMKDMVIEK